MDNEQKLLLMRKEALEYLEASGKILRNITPPMFLGDLELWLKSRRLIDPAIFITRALSTLEDKLFEERVLTLATLAGAAAAISDDLIDNKAQIPYERIVLLQRNKADRSEGLLGLFDTFNNALLGNLPSTFPHQYSRLIIEYNKAQKDSARLFEDAITLNEIKDIKNRAGGYSSLLLYAIMLEGSLEQEEKKHKGRSQKKKFSELYCFGGWLSKIDDLWDEEKDREGGMKQLATEGIVTWQMLYEETEKIKKRLKGCFQADSVEKMFKEHYAYLIDEALFRKYNIKR